MSGGNVRLKMDGREIWAEAGKTVLAVALDNEIEIPHFCYHPGIGVEGSCRLCLVEIEGMPKLQTSCTVPVKEGMVVSTDSETARKARKGVLEFFLLNHPLDCPFCDKGGECPLQNFTLDSGQFASRFKFEKIHKPKHQIVGEHIVLDKERCVLCNRCVRFSRDLAGHEELAIRKRGARCEIFVPDGVQLTSGFTGNLADLCPVGALTTREFRFKARPWEMTAVHTICGECSLGCNVQAWRKGNDLLRLTPRIAPSVNEWWLCDRGRFSIHGIPDSERLQVPLRPGNGSEAITPETVASVIAGELQHLPPHGLAIVTSPMLTNEEFYSLKILAKAAKGGRLFIPVSEETRSLMGSLHRLGLEADFPAFLERSRTVRILGENIEEQHPVLALRIRRLARTREVQISSAGSDGFLPGGFEKLLGGENPICAFLSDRWITQPVMPALEKELEALQGHEEEIRISVLLGGANARGLIDQWDETVFPLSRLETEIQRGKIEGLIWFGEAPANEVFDEYARGMGVFIQVVPRAEDAHRAAKWVLPLDLFPEKRGTTTNNFGRVQILRKTRRVIAKGFAPLELVRNVASRLGETFSQDEGHLYVEIARGLPTYPRTAGEIPEFTKTYDYYERALWR